jgi:hypothetical protein
MTIFLILLCIGTQAHAAYFSASVQEQADTWKSTYIETFQNPQHTQTLIDVLLLSHKIAQESCNMMITKLTAQEELFKIYTPSLNDPWYTNKKVLDNDTSKIEAAVADLKTAQNHIQATAELFKKVGPKILQINPAPTQTLINDLKHALLFWGKQQHALTCELDSIQQEFSSAISTISDIKVMFATFEQIPEFKHCHLKEAACCVAKTNKDIESIFAHVTQIRKLSIIKIKQFFASFFKIYYTVIYDLLSEEEKTSLECMATEDKKLPDPATFFE